MNLKNIFTGSALAFAILTTGVAINAQQTAARFMQDGQNIEKQWQQGRRGFRHGRSHSGGQRLMARLNLSEAQKTQISQIRSRFREEIKLLREHLRAARQNARAANADGAFNESAVRAAAQATNNIRVELAVAKAKMRAEIFNVLTAEQKAQLAQLKEQRKLRREEFKARRQAAQEQSL